MLRPLLLSSLALTLSACQSRLDYANDLTPIDDGQLQFVDESAMNSITEARAELLERRDAVATAEYRVDEAGEQARLSEGQVEIESERVERAQDLVAASERPDSRDAAKAELDQARRAMAKARAKLRHDETLIELRETELRLAEREEALAGARVELSKAEAVAEVDREDIEEIELFPYRASVRELETEVGVTKARVKGLGGELELMLRAFENADRD